MNPGRFPFAPQLMLLALLVQLLVIADAAAHDGHDHGAPETSATPPEAFRRFADGTVLLPHMAQIALAIKVAPLGAQEAAPGPLLSGRVVPNPTTLAKVQAPRSGRVVLGDGPLAHVGMHVSKGDTLVTLEPVLTLADENTLRQQLLNIDRELALLTPRAEHIGQVNPLMPMGDATVQLMREMQIQSESLNKQREATKDLLSKIISLTAPISGTVSVVAVARGQMVEPRDTLIEIVADGPHRIEAWTFASITTDRIDNAAALTPGGERAELRFLGRSPALRQQAQVLLFEAPNARWPIGMPLRVSIEGTGPQGFVVPTGAVAKTPEGRDVVWEQTGPESFVERRVEVSPGRDGQVVVKGALKPGTNIVVDGAAALAFAP